MKPRVNRTTFEPPIRPPQLIAAPRLIGALPRLLTLELAVYSQTVGAGLSARPLLPLLFSRSSPLLFIKASGFALCPPFSLLLLCVFRAASAVSAVSSICVYLSFFLSRLFSVFSYSSIRVYLPFLLSRLFTVSVAFSSICVYPRSSAVPCCCFCAVVVFAYHSRFPLLFRR